jgi:hypothetical protein
VSRYNPSVCENDLRKFLDGTTIAILRQIEATGWAVLVKEQGRQITAIHSDMADRVAVMNEDPYKAACELAGLVGIELDDG